MSFRELRNLTEMMRALGYPRPVSMDNFRKPNFELVSDLLYWMVKKYDPSSSITEEIDTEEDRVQFLTQVASEVLVKARIRLNPKKLYAADGFAVKELIKLARVLYEASRIDVQKLDSSGGAAGGSGTGGVGSMDDDDDEVSIKSLLGSRVKDPKATRQLSSDITQSGAKLYELLEAELDVRDLRAQALRFLDALSNNSDNSAEQKFLERSLQEILQSTQENVEMTERQCVELEAEEKALSAKIKKAQTDLERSEKRLKSLQHVRPAFMDEYEKLEKELERQYAIYCERFRNLDYLQRELDLLNARELKKLAENDRSLKKLQKKFREDELAILRGEQEDQMDSGSLLEPSENNKNKSAAGAKSAAAKGAASGNNNNARKSPGNQKQAAVGSGNAKSGGAANARGATGGKPAATKARRDVDDDDDDDDSGSDADSGSGSEDEDDATSDESGGEDNSGRGRGGAAAARSGGGGGGGARAGGGGADASDSDEVSLADSGELIDNDDESGSDGSEGSKSGSQQSGSETNSDSDQDF